MPYPYTEFLTPLKAAHLKKTMRRYIQHNIEAASEMPWRALVDLLENKEEKKGLFRLRWWE
jgi:hypothetical protein